jgi:diacylglycerol kinase family enzyme
MPPESETTLVAAPSAWVGLIANAASGSGRSLHAVRSIEESLASQGIKSRIARTPADRERLVREAHPDTHCLALVVAGGDGTVSALINEKPRVPIAVLPSGTENLFARHFALGEGAGNLARAIKGGQSRRIDLGSARTRRFALMAGIGFDADVVTRHHDLRRGPRGSLRTTSRFAYVEPVLRAAFTYRFPVITVEIIDPGPVESVSGTYVFFFNLPRYALGLPFVPSARDDDGALDLLVFRDPGPWRALRYLWQIARGRHLADPRVIHRKVRRATVHGAEATPIQLDGDPAGTLTGSPLEIEVLPGALEVVIPPQGMRERPP